MGLAKINRGFVYEREDELRKAEKVVVNGMRQDP